MEALKWIGYVVAAVAVLSVIVGFGVFIVVAAVIGAALFSAVTIVLAIAGEIRNAFESGGSRR